MPEREIDLVLRSLRDEPFLKPDEVVRTTGSNLFFFFQAVDGIRDGHVTGVQTCALPIFVMLRSRDDGARAEAIRKSMTRFGARVTTIGDSPDAEIRLPPAERILRPIISIVPLQFLAYYAALERRANPDIMRTDIRRYREGLEPLFH